MEEEGSTHSMGTKRPRSSLEDNSTLEKSVKRPVNGEDCISKELVVILDAGAQYGKVNLPYIYIYKAVT